jgi:hypothetical protein
MEGVRDYRAESCQPVYCSGALRQGTGSHRLLFSLEDWSMEQGERAGCACEHRQEYTVQVDQSSAEVQDEMLPKRACLDINVGHLPRTFHRRNYIVRK